VLVVGKKNLGDLRHELWVLFADETFSSSKEGSLVLLGRDHLLEHASTTWNFIDNVGVEDGLSKHSQSLVLGLDAQLLSLEVDLHVLHILDATLGLGSTDDPASELIIRVVAVSFAFGIFIIIEVKLLLEIVRQLLSASLNGLFGDIDSPFIILVIGTIQIFSLSVDTTCKLIIATSFKSQVFSIGFAVDVVRETAVRTCVSISISLGVAVLFCLSTASFLVGLVLLALLWLILEDERAELETKVYVSAAGRTLCSPM